jgi:peptide/nickel transport system permease protein
LAETTLIRPASIWQLSARPRPSAARAVYRFLRANPLTLAGLVIFILWAVISVAAPRIAPHGPLEQNVAERLQPPSRAHLFGTDQLGRDVLTRILFGGRLSLSAGIAVVIIACLIGTAIGALAGFIGSWFDELIMRLTEVFMAFPTIILAMAIAAALGPSLFNAVLAMVIIWWPNYARLVRSLVLMVKAQDYVEAARAIGVPEGRILLNTVLPNSLAPAIVLATMDLGNAILVFAGLSFLGLGPEPSSPEWGRMIADGIQYFDQWWMAAFPGLAIFTVVMGFNFIGDGIRDALDPRLRTSG